MTITNNSATGAGGGVIHDNGAITTDIGNSIIAGNTRRSAPDITNTIGNITSSGGNIVQDATGTGVDFAPSEIGIDPLLGGLTDNGGDLMTHAPAAPEAIDGAIRSLGSTTDQRGFLRGDGSPDIGAYEASSSAVTTAYYLDQFNAVAFNGDDGTLSWTNDWQEVGETGPAAGPANGDIKIETLVGEQGLGFGDDLDGAWREADLSGATSAILSLDYARINMEADDYVALSISTDGGSVWTEIDRYQGIANDAALQGISYDISAYIDNDTQIGFFVSGFGQANDQLLVDNVRIDLGTSPPVTTSLSPVKDTYIADDPGNPTDQDTNYGSDTVIRMDEGGGGLGEGRVLLEFDLSTIPAGATITSATLQVEASGKTGTIPDSSVINVYEVTEAWDEGAGGMNNDATWNERQTGTAWGGGPGGSFDGTALASLTVSGLGGHTWDITDLAQDWQSGDKTNNGLMLASNDLGTVVFDYVSREGGTPPQLVITYTTAPVTANVAPTFTSFVGPATSGDEDSEITVTFGNLAVQGDEWDTDGSVDAFVVKSVTSGTLKIGTSAGTATAWAAGSNDTLDALTNAYWTPDSDANGTLNAFEVVAEDDDGAESSTKVTVQVTVNSVNDAPSVSVPIPVFINEIHYDNIGADTGEAIEIAGLAGNDLSGWSLVLYNGFDGSVYDTVNLSGHVLRTRQTTSVRSIFNFPANGIQNATGLPDGVALVDSTGSVVQFLSYEGTFTAVGGPANGMLSTDIGVSEDNGTTAIGESLQLTGSGATFTWAAAASETFGSVNTGQDFAALAAATNQTVNEDSNLVFSTGNGNAIVVDDVDAALAAAPDPVSVTLTVSNGTLTLGSTAGLGSVAGNASNSVTFTGTVAELNSAMEGLIYRSAADYNGSDTLIVLVDDLGNDGVGGAKTATGTVYITVDPVNDAPTATNLTTTSPTTRVMRRGDHRYRGQRCRYRRDHHRDPDPGQHRDGQPECQ